MSAVFFVYIKSYCYLWLLFYIFNQSILRAAFVCGVGWVAFRVHCYCVFCILLFVSHPFFIVFGLNHGFTGWLHHVVWICCSTLFVGACIMCILLDSIWIMICLVLVIVSIVWVCLVCLLFVVVPSFATSSAQFGLLNHRLFDLDRLVLFVNHSTSVWLLVCCFGFTAGCVFACGSCCCFCGCGCFWIFCISAPKLNNTYIYMCITELLFLCMSCLFCLEGSVICLVWFFWGYN